MKLILTQYLKSSFPHAQLRAIIVHIMCLYTPQNFVWRLFNSEISLELNCARQLLCQQYVLDQNSQLVQSIPCLKLCELAIQQVFNEPIFTRLRINAFKSMFFNSKQALMSLVAATRKQGETTVILVLVIQDNLSLSLHIEDCELLEYQMPLIVQSYILKHIFYYKMMSLQRHILCAIIALIALAVLRVMIRLQISNVNGAIMLLKLPRAAKIM
ncbi:Hypothetical_protein [Hexamita inflata]|uniref:Hypothetical_protein n=2 Tax=Hexamita inflata TaxID=28002 RepID=A0AA86PXJ1_9EUKA|nr:Hypothetical protein HINF_LOCUS35714 [Hexamita inflata]CAI9948072.1 Hypothetical protein HINF_LOCUS35717 [Hexamita inflata]CAI9948074.1 Hypothetical protein HINF_LOCUS35719 [Hexamita inflata]